LFSNTLNLCSSLNVRDQVPHPYRTRGKIKKYCASNFDRGFGQTEGLCAVCTTRTVRRNFDSGRVQHGWTQRSW
jgi:hypothetical protein